MATKIVTSFGTGGSGLTPNDSQGTPTLVTALRDAAESLRALAIGAAVSTPATRTSAAGPFNMAGGKRLTLVVGGVLQNIDFVDADFANPAAAVDTEIVAVLSNAYRGLQHARASAPGGGVVTIDSEEVGTAALLNIQASTAQVAMTFVIGAVAGTGINISPVKG